MTLKKKVVVEDEASDWYKGTKLGESCDPDTHCRECEPNGNCDRCDTIHGRWITAVADYASTCDGPCMELTSHELLNMDPETQLGYCGECVKTLPPEIKERVLAYAKGNLQ